MVSQSREWQEPEPPPRGGFGKRIADFGVRAAALMLLGGCSLVLDFSEEADAGAEDMRADAFLIDMEKCMAYEANNEYATATDMAAGTLDAAICPGVDKDYYRFTVAQDGQVTIELQFAHGVGDLAMELYDESEFRPEFNPVATVDTGDDNESYTQQLAAGDYVLQVYSNLQGENEYTLTLTVP